MEFAFYLTRIFFLRSETFKFILIYYFFLIDEAFGFTPKKCTFSDTPHPFLVPNTPHGKRITLHHP